MNASLMLVQDRTSWYRLLPHQGDAAPYRLMFWEDISAEFLECIARGITPIFLGTPSIYEYVEPRVSRSSDEAEASSIDVRSESMEHASLP